MTEVKLGIENRKITGWRQTATSPIAPAYEHPARQLISQPDDWKPTLTRFAQLYKNLMLGHCLAEGWSSGTSPMGLHLLVIVNGAAAERKADGSVWTYQKEFEIFPEGCSLPSSRLHFITWQGLGKWVIDLQNPAWDFLQERLCDHPLL
jgi:hypothetical protein